MAQVEQAIHIFPDIEKALGFSAAIKANGTLYMSGMIAIDAGMKIVGVGDMYTQVKTIYATLSHALAEQGLSLKNVLKETVFVTDLAAMETGRKARQEAYAAAQAYPPASTMVEVKALFTPEVMVEIEIIAQT
ncbi:MAG TPA: RidA family protein [Rhizomicrobium sp.]|jgi:enamine deaminase RidA (YjgF/YER057c/UK114 family)